MALNYHIWIIEWFVQVVRMCILYACVRRHRTERARSMRCDCWFFVGCCCCYSRYIISLFFLKQKIYVRVFFDLLFLKDVYRWMKCNVFSVRKQWPKNIYFIAPYFNGWTKLNGDAAAAASAAATTTATIIILQCVELLTECDRIIITMCLVISKATMHNNDGRLCVAAAHHIDKYRLFK